MQELDKKEWSEAIENVLRLFGYEGHVTIEESEDPGQWLINHPAFGCPFIGFYPKVEEIFTVATMEHEYVDHNGFKKQHKEGIVFDSDTLLPLYYSICNGNEYQRIIITGFKGNQKGAILYNNMWVKGGSRTQVLEEPYFDSEIFDVNMVVHAARRET